MDFPVVHIPAIHHTKSAVEAPAFLISGAIYLSLENHCILHGTILVIHHITEERQHVKICSN